MPQTFRSYAPLQKSDLKSLEIGRVLLIKICILHSSKGLKTEARKNKFGFLYPSRGIKIEIQKITKNRFYTPPGV